MIFLIFLFLSLDRSSSSLASPFYDRRSLPVVDTDIFNLGSNPNVFTTRSIWNIVWSCLVTIFACTWIAVHPNIPAPKDGPVRVFARRLAIMGYLLMSPEMVILWTARQHFGALEIAKRHQARGWTKAHAFFVIMGGFSLYENGTLLRTLQISELEQLDKQGKVDWPSITQEEIEDKSKGDYLSKGFVVVQTGWFIVQCIVRGAEGLVVTELEVVTLAFSTLTLIIYVLWWNKPLDIGMSVPVYLKDGYTLASEGEKDASPMPSETQRQPGEREGPPDTLNSPKLDPTSTIMIPSAETQRQPGEHDGPPDTLNSPKLDPASTTIIPSASQHSLLSPPKQLGRITRFRNFIREKQKEDGRFLGLAYLIFKFPLDLFFSPIGDMVSCTTLEEEQFRVPTFYSAKVENEVPAYLIAFCVAIAFGGIHCIAWSFHFPSSVERWMWRIAALLVTGLPLSITFLSILMNIVDHRCSPRMAMFLTDLITLFLMFLVGAYMVSRIFLLVLPLMALRALPSGAYVDLNWIAFFPHI